jgi:NAD(P)-dependent dehydrogenase (short-subunit alcohol dehydrogenase family)
MRRQRSGRILNMSSLGGLRGAGGWGIYCSTKFAVEGLSEALAQELKPLGIHVTAIEPGYFRTDFLDSTSLVTNDAPIDDYHETSGAMRTRASGANHQQPGDPAKLAKVLVSFADTENPPVHLPLGSDAVAALEAKIADLAEVVRTWRTTSVSTDFR